MDGRGGRWVGLRSAIGARQRGVVDAGLGFDQRSVLRSGRRWAGLRSAIGAGQRGVVGAGMDFDRRSALGFGGLSREAGLIKMEDWKMKQEEERSDTGERERKERKRKKYFFNKRRERNLIK